MKFLVTALPETPPQCPFSRYNKTYGARTCFFTYLECIPAQCRFLKKAEDTDEDTTEVAPLRVKRTKSLAVYPNIIKFLLDNKFSYLDAARKSGIAPSTFSHVINGDSPPSHKTIEKILKFTNMPYEVAFKRSDK